jgi:hypothetical protein
MNNRNINNYKKDEGGGGNVPASSAKESDPLLLPKGGSGTSIRSRRSPISNRITMNYKSHDDPRYNDGDDDQQNAIGAVRTPAVRGYQSIHDDEQDQHAAATTAGSSGDNSSADSRDRDDEEELQYTPYAPYNINNSRNSAQQNQQRLQSYSSGKSLRNNNSTTTTAAAGAACQTDNDTDAPPLLEIPEEIYAVRKAALQVLKPLTKTWVRAIAPWMLLLR